MLVSSNNKKCLKKHSTFSRITTQSTLVTINRNSEIIDFIFFKKKKKKEYTNNEKVRVHTFIQKLCKKIVRKK